METLGAIRISEPLQQDSQKVPTTPSGTAPVPASLVQLHLSSWVRIISVGLALVEDLVMEGGTLMTQCGTHRGAKVGAQRTIGSCPLWDCLGHIHIKMVDINGSLLLIMIREYNYMYTYCTNMYN